MIAPEHLELLTADPAVAACRWCATRARCSSARGRRPRSGDYVAGVNHVLPTARTARFASALRVDTFRKHVHVVEATEAGLAALAPHLRGARRRRGSRRARALGRRRCAQRRAHRATGRLVTAPVSPARRPPRARGLPLAAARRLGAAQHQREPVRAAGRVRRPLGRRAARTRRSTAIPTAAPRDLRDALGAHLGQPAERLFCANGSNEVLQTLLLTYGGPGRRAAMFEPTYALHSHIARITGTEVVVGERRADFSIDPDVARALHRGARADDRVRVQPQQPDRHGRARGHDRGAARRRRRPPRRRRRGVRRVRAVERARARARRPPARRRAHVLEGVVDGGAAARLRGRRPRGSSRSSRRSCCRTTSRRPRRSPVGSRSTSATRWTTACSAWSPSASGSPPSSTASTGVTVYPSGANFLLFRPGRRRPRALAAAGRPGRARARLLPLAPPRRLPACHHRHARGERRLPRRAPQLAPGSGRLMPRTSEQHRTTKETTIDLVLDVDGGGERVGVDRHPVLRPHARAAREARRLRPPHRGRRATSRSTSTTRSKTSASCSAPRSRRRSATRPACGASRRRSCRSTRRWCRSRSTSPVDRSSCTTSIRSSEWIGTFDPQLAEEFWRAFAFGAGITLHIRSLSGRNGHHVIEASFKGVARALRDAVKIEGTGVPSTKGTL